MIRVFLIGFIAVAIGACSPQVAVVKELKRIEKKFQDHTGFYLYHPQSQKTLVDYHGDRYFIPASNTKIFTFYTSLKLLGDSVIGVYYQQRSDSLILWGSGDPSFLYPYVFQTNKVYDFLQKSSSKLFLSTPAAQNMIKPLGPGWAWSDYTYSYSAERSAFPLYGNLIRAENRGDNIIHTKPAVFMERVAYSNTVGKEAELIREVDSNMLTFFPGETMKSEKWEVPFRTSSDVVAELLADTLKKPVEEIAIPRSKIVLSLKSTPVDSLYKVMMQESDNFIAEQLLLMCAGAVSDTLRSDIGIQYALKNLVNDLPDKPIWVDGSGLSRYNLFTPRSIVMLWDKIQKEVPQERLLPLLATGGKYGTIRSWYKSEPPFIYGKTGSLSNNHSLSGLLFTKKGNVLLFSFMNNNFIAPGNEVRKEMEKMLYYIRDHF